MVKTHACMHIYSIIRLSSTSSNWYVFDIDVGAICDRYIAPTMALYFY